MPFEMSTSTKYLKKITFVGVWLEEETRELWEEQSKLERAIYFYKSKIESMILLVSKPCLLLQQQAYNHAQMKFMVSILLASVVTSLTVRYYTHVSLMKSRINHNVVI